MKEIKAIVQPFMVEKVLSALDAMEDIPGATISEIMGGGRLPERRHSSAGKIFVHQVDHAVRIRTGEPGLEAI